IYWAKVLAAATYGLALMTVLFATSIIGSLIAWGLHGATLLDGRHVGGGHALGLDALAYLTYLLPLAVLIGVAVFLSTVTRNSAAAIVGTVIFSLAFQGIAVLPGIKQAKDWLFPKQFEAWESLFGHAGDSIAPAALAALIGVLLLAGGNGLLSFGERHVPSGAAALLVASVSLWLVLLERIANGTRIRRRALAGLAGGFAGVALLVAPTNSHGIAV